MMRSSRSSVLMLLPISLPLLGAVLLTGCAAPPPKTTPAPVFVASTPQQAEDLQAEYQKIVAGARVGHVSAVNTQAGTAAVLGIPLGDVHMGDSIQFMDARQVGVANGTVTGQDNANSDYPFLIVDYTPVTGGRAPKAGDLAVYIPRK